MVMTPMPLSHEIVEAQSAISKYQDYIVSHLIEVSFNKSVSYRIQYFFHVKSVPALFFFPARLVIQLESKTSKLQYWALFHCTIGSCPCHIHHMSLPYLGIIANNFGISNHLWVNIIFSKSFTQKSCSSIMKDSG